MLKSIAMLYLLITCTGTVLADKLPDAPVAKPPAKNSFFASYFKDKPVLALTAANAAMTLTDGISTKHWEHADPGCESGPFRAVLGCRPTWGRMAPLGAVEVFGGSILAHEMRQSRHAWVRHMWWVPQTVSISFHSKAVAYNYRHF